MILLPLTPQLKMKVFKQVIIILQANDVLILMNGSKSIYIVLFGVARKHSIYNNYSELL